MNRDALRAARNIIAGRRGPTTQRGVATQRGIRAANFRRGNARAYQ